MLIAKGAEAYLFKEDWYGYKVIRKKRIKKIYRHPKLDENIRRQRTLLEARIMNEARYFGVLTPLILNIDLKNTTIIYEYIDGEKLKKLFDKLYEKKREKLSIKIGEMIAKLHKNDIIHGDLTTSNMILTDNNIYFIDFGLSEHSSNVEKKGVDLHLLKRALESTHYNIAKKSYREILNGYKKVYGKHADEIIKRVTSIESRGRYITDRE
jgi:TP53 regulating kinase-like protein